VEDVQRLLETYHKVGHASCHHGGLRPTTCHQGPAANQLARVQGSGKTGWPICQGKGGEQTAALKHM